MSAPGREDYACGVAGMVAEHPDSTTPLQKRYDWVVTCLDLAGFTPDELRGMLAVALDQLKHGASVEAAK